jgi:glutathione peroxidase
MLSIPHLRNTTLALRCCIIPVLLAFAFASAAGLARSSPSKENVYDFSLVDQNGKVVPLANYKGKVLLIVNLASQSFYSTQIAALNELQQEYGPQGLQVLGIPSADFGGEELKDPAAMRAYYAATAHANFPVFASAIVTGVQAIPLFQYLCDPREGISGGDLRWSYTKFLIGRDGEPLARYEVAVNPSDVDFHVAVEKALTGTFKPEKEKDAVADNSD